MARAINKSRSRFDDDRQSNRHGIAIADRCALKTRSTFNPVGLIEQFPDSDLRFARVALPFGDRIGKGLVGFKEPPARGGEPSHPQELFFPTKVGPPPGSRAAIGVM